MNVLKTQATVDVTTAAKMIGISRATAFKLIAANEFPVRVIRVGKRIVVPTAGLRALLGIEEVPA